MSTILIKFVLFYFTYIKIRNSVLILQNFRWSVLKQKKSSLKTILKFVQHTYFNLYKFYVFNFYDDIKLESINDRFILAVELPTFHVFIMLNLFFPNEIKEYPHKIYY